MRVHRGLLLAIFLYLTLDLSLPMMPGAFVFEPDDSVESAQVHRGRGAMDAPLLARDALAPRRVCVDIAVRLKPAFEPPARRSLAVRRPSRAALDPASPSEDPH